MSRLAIAAAAALLFGASFPSFAQSKRLCLNKCKTYNPQGGDDLKRCESQCDAIAEGKASGKKDRETAQKSADKESKTVTLPGGLKGKAGPVAERTKALAAFQKAVGILKAASKIQAGRAGYIGDTVSRERKIRDLQGDCESQFRSANGEKYTYEPLQMMANQIISDYNASLKAPRYGGETYKN